MLPELETLSIPGAVLAACFGAEGKPAYASTIESSRLVELLRVYESRHGITPASKADIAMHIHHHKLLLKLVLDGGKMRTDDWVTAAASNILWSGFNHPGLGASLRREAVTMLRGKKRATMLFEIREGALYFYLSDGPLPAAARPMNEHIEPKRLA